jgi:VanZ family protein
VTRLYVLVLALIVYGSLYPFRFAPAASEPAAELFRSAQRSMYVRDGLVNVGFYLPVGACGYLTMRKRRGRLGAFALATAAGTFLSLSVEMVQSAYSPTRLASLYDIGTNSIGSFLGAGIAAVYSRVQRKLDNDPAALVLLITWLAYLWFPLLALIVPLRLVDVEWTMIGLISTAAAWYVMGHAIEAAGFRPVNAWLLASLLAIPPRFAVLPRDLVLADVAGAAAGAAAFLCVRIPCGPALLLLLVIRGLVPFRFAEFNALSWVPFAGLLEANWQRSTVIIADKLFFYGATIWALHGERAKIRTAAFTTAAVLLCVEVAQQWMARIPEITDPILALMIGVGLDAFERRPRRTSSPS